MKKRKITIEIPSWLSFQRVVIFSLLLLFLDVVLLGSGKMVRFEGLGLSISSRMILFGICCVELIIYILVKRKTKLIFSNKIALVSFLLICVLILFSIMNGLFQKTGWGYIWHDLKKYLSLFIFPLIVISDLVDTKNIRFFKIAAVVSSLLISIFSIFVFLTSKYTILDSYHFFHSIMPQYEIVQRGTGGGIYLPSQITVFYVFIIQIYFLLIKRKESYFLLFSTLINLYGLAQTGTRSFLFVIYPLVVVFIVVYIVKRLMNMDRNTFSIRTWDFVFLASWFVLISLILNTTAINRMISSDEPGTGKRSTYITEIFENISFFGKGFGASLPSTEKADLEIPVLEVLYEQGILGVAIWGFGGVYFSYVLVKKHRSIWYLIAFYALFVASMANPYILSPMGWFAIIWSYLFSRFSSSLQISNQPSIRNN